MVRKGIITADNEPRSATDRIQTTEAAEGGGEEGQCVGSSGELLLTHRIDARDVGVVGAILKTAVSSIATQSTS